VRASRAAAAARWALAGAAVWLVCVGAYAAGFFLGTVDAPPSGLTALLLVAAALGPLAPLAAAVALLRDAAAPGSETAPRAADDATARALAARLDAIETALKALRTTPAPQRPEAREPRPEPRRSVAPRATEPARAPAPVDQPALPFSETKEREAAALIPWSDVVRALDFPRDANDAAGFAALRSALRDPEAQRLLQAAEDVLTILASAGLHMEDVKPDPAALETWVAYAEGARGARVSAIGGVRDEAALRAAQERLRADPIFRDAALVFIRRWNQFLARVAKELGADETLLDLADTRTGRAFMLTARALGAFD
jgi:hypothetical protein